MAYTTKLKTAGTLDPVNASVANITDVRATNVNANVAIFATSLTVNGVAITGGGGGGISEAQITNANVSANANAAVFAITNAGALTVTLPVAGEGVSVFIKHAANDINAVNVVPAAGTLEATTHYTLSTPYEAIMVICDGTNWWLF